MDLTYLTDLTSVVPNNGIKIWDSKKGTQRYKHTKKRYKWKMKYAKLRRNVLLFLVLRNNWKHISLYIRILCSFVRPSKLGETATRWPVSYSLEFCETKINKKLSTLALQTPTLLIFTHRVHLLRDFKPWVGF